MRRASPVLGPAGDIEATLASSALFQSIDPSLLQSLEHEVTRRSLRGGETLFSAGEPGESLFVVVYGRLRAHRTEPTGELRVLGEVGRGEAVGELAILTGAPRSATVSAIRDTELIQLSRAGFERLLVQHPQMMLELTRQIIARYQSSPAGEEARPVTVALIPASPDVPIRQFASGLVEALDGGRRVLHLDAERLTRVWREPVGASAEEVERALAGWLHEQELQHDYVVYQGDPTPTAWTGLCARQADRVLIVAAGNGPPSLRAELRRWLQPVEAAVAPHSELVLLFDSAVSEPRGTAGWLAQVPVQRHHHVDPGRRRDLDRLARTITGTATGLVLGGGGARGLAHLGVIKALEEAAIPIDLVGGTSIGAIMAGQVACGWDSRTIIAESRRVFVERGSLNDFTIPLIALLVGRRYSRMLQSLFGERLIEDLPLPCFCVSTNLTRGESGVHAAGLVRKWVGASIAVPGLGPPIFAGREILVDGGVSNNLPVDVMRRWTRGPVFAVNVSPREELRLDREYPDALSPWRVLLSRLNPFGTPIRVPGIGSILVRTVTLPPTRAGAEPDRTPDLLFEPPTQRFRLLDWRAFDQLVEIGYRSALETLERWDRTRYFSERNSP